MDRFLFYVTPPVFMLVALLIDRAWRGWSGRSWARRARRALAVGTGLAVAGTPVMYPIAITTDSVRDAFAQQAFGGSLKRDLAAVGPRQPTQTPAARANQQLEAGFNELA